MNRVMRQPVLGPARPLGGPDPPILDPGVRAAVDQAAAAAYERGIAEGAAAERRRGRELDDALTATIASALDGAVSALRELQDESAVAFLDAALEAAEFVLGHSPHDGGSALEARVRAALADADDDRLRLSVSPGDHDRLSATLETITDLEVESDPSLAPGEARLAGRWASADLTRRAALDAIRDAVAP